MNYIQNLQSIYRNHRFIRMLSPVVIFVFFIFSISYKMLPSGGIIDYVDTIFFFPGSFFNYFSVWVSSFLGSYNPNMFGIPITGNLPTILSFFGIANNYASYILNYLPVLFLCLLVFFVTKKISRNNFYAYFAGFFIILNNFILQQFFLWPGHYFYNVIGLVLLIYQTYKIYRYRERLELKDVLILILVSVFAIHALYFVIYLAYLLLFFIFSLFRLEKNRGRYILLVLLAFVGIILIHSYWLSPFILNHSYQSVPESFNGNQLPVFQGYIRLASYSNLINYYNYLIPAFSLPNDNILQYLFYFVYFGLIIGVVYKIRKKQAVEDNDRKFLIFMLLIYVIFFAFALGPNEKTLGGIWMYLFDHVPFFGFFRSFTRFLIMSLVSTIFIFAIFVRGWTILPKRKNLIIGLFTAFLILSNLIFFTGDLNGAIGTAKIPQEYFNVDNEYFKNDPANFSFISFPTVPYESYDWSMNKNIDLFSSDIYFNLYFFSKPAIYNDLTMQLQRRGEFFTDVFALDFKPYKNLDKDLSRLNAKYVFVHKDLINTLKKGEPAKYDKYLGYFKGNKKYSLMEENKYFYLFKFNDFTPILSADNLSFYRVFDTKYRLIFKNLKTKTDLSFLTSFHKGWNLYPVKNTDDKRCERLPVASYKYEGKKITECLNGRILFEGEELSYLWQKPVFSDTHSLIYAYANRWTIDPDYVKQNFNKSNYTENSDGSIDIELMLYFKPQSYFYLGLAISGVVLLFCLGYLVWNLVKRKDKMLT